MRAMRVFLGAIGFLCLAVPLAHADAIDGDWCSPNGARHLTIDGPKMMTPGGARIEGSYTRHTFDYVAPAREVEAGKKVEMRLMGETAVQFRPDGESQAQIWRRCARPVS
ncbi:MAG: hypothetical protein HY059_08590 [Proteobacteria bacterium]|nr:hypothetical protein [Pseudomonadota bacterium]